MRRLVFGLLLISLASTPALSSECKSLSKARAGLDLVWANTNQRVERAFDDVRWVSRDYRPVVLCEFASEIYAAFAAPLAAGRYAIVLRSGLPDMFTDSELRAVIGHEVAHIVLGHNSNFGAFAGPDISRMQKHELEADALSARWFGAGAAASAAEKFLSAFPDFRSPLTEERIAVLRKLQKDSAGPYE